MCLNFIQAHTGLNGENYYHPGRVVLRNTRSDWEQEHRRTDVHLRIGVSADKT